MTTTKRYLPLLAFVTLTPILAHGVVTGPYTADSNTIGLYHFDVSAGPTDPGNPFVNYGNGGSSLDLTNTGGPDGRDNTGPGGYGADSFSGFGYSFDTLASGNGTYHSGSSGSSVGGGTITNGSILQSSLQGASGAFTYEAIISLSSGITDEQTIIGHDGNLSNRSFLFRVTDGELNLYTGGISANLTSVIPTVGENAFVVNNWYHVAVTYSGDEMASDNVSFYWTALDSSATEANLIGTATLTSDLNDSISNPFGVGTTTRSPFRQELEGFVDEVRISSIARGADDFIFSVVPEPTSAALVMSFGLAALCRRRLRK